MSDLSKKFSIHSSTSSLNLLFFLPDLLSTAIRRLNLLARVSIRPSFADRMDVMIQSCDHFGSKLFLLKMLKTCLVLFLRLTLQCWPTIPLTFLLMIFPEKDSFFLLEPFVQFGYRCFLLSLSVIFSCSIVGLIQITFLLTISSAVIFVFCLPFSITSC